MLHKYHDLAKKRGVVVGLLADKGFPLSSWSPLIQIVFQSGSMQEICQTDQLIARPSFRSGLGSGRHFDLSLRSEDSGNLWRRCEGERQRATRVGVSQGF